VQEEDLDPEVMGQTSSAFKNLPELEKIKVSDSDEFAGRTSPSPEYVRSL
jgi:hypothetical protein